MMTWKKIAAAFVAWVIVGVVLGGPMAFIGWRVCVDHNQGLVGAYDDVVAHSAGFGILAGLALVVVWAAWLAVLRPVLRWSKRPIRYCPDCYRSHHCVTSGDVITTRPAPGGTFVRTTRPSGGWDEAFVPDSERE